MDRGARKCLPCGEVIFGKRSISGMRLEGNVICKENNSEELLVTFQVFTDALSYAKKQQWVVTNYSLLLFAGISGFYQLIKDRTSGFGDTIIIVFAVSIAVLGTGFLLEYQLNLLDYRKRKENIIKKIREKNPTIFMGILPCDRSDNIVEKEFFNWFFYAFVFFIWLGAFSVNWLVETQFSYLASLSSYLKGPVGFLIQLAVFFVLALGTIKLFYKYHYKKELEDLFKEVYLAEYIKFEIKQNMGILAES